MSHKEGEMPKTIEETLKGLREIREGSWSDDSLPTLGFAITILEKYQLLTERLRGLKKEYLCTHVYEGICGDCKEMRGFNQAIEACIEEVQK